MNREQLIARFEAEMSKVQRPGVDKLMEYIRKSDFYTAPASTRYHLSCEGGLLQHSLNVLDALRGLLIAVPGGCEYRVHGKPVARLTEENVIIMALLHDICKTYFYTTSWRNAKNEQTGKWEKVPYFAVKDRMPLGHGDKSVMIIKQYMNLTNDEMYAIWWHMGFTDTQDTLSMANALSIYPIIWELHTADMMASYMMEKEDGNKDDFAAADPAPESAGEYADNPPIPEEAPPQFEDAPPVMQEA